MPSLFRPHRLLFNGHAMTIAGALLRAAPPRQGTVERRFTVDAETTVLALCDWQPEPSRAPTVLALHGLTGSADASYLRRLAAKAHARGFNVVRLNTRNCGGTERLTPTLYHSGLTTDCRAVLGELVQEGLHPHLVGFSMGGNVALKLAAELGPEAPRSIASVAAVSPPISLADASRAIDSGLFNGIYQRSFLDYLTGLVRKKASLHPGRYDLRALDRIRSLFAFDDRYIAPEFGFNGAADYYARASAGPLLDQLAVPTLVIHARDDSIIPTAPFEEWAARGAPNVQVLLTDRGGHSAFIGRASRLEDRYWAENRVLDFLGS